MQRIRTPQLAEESPMPPTMTPQEFVAKWRGDTRKERSVAQEHYIDLCRMLGHDTPGDNHDGSLAFEAGIDKQTPRTREHHAGVLLLPSLGTCMLK
jgi:hypothetical protein